MGSIQDELFKTIKILTKGYLSKENIPRTVASTVEGIVGDTYKCNIDGAYYYLKNGSGCTITNGSSVWVHIPYGKMNNAFIMGKR